MKNYNRIALKTNILQRDIAGVSLMILALPGLLAAQMFFQPLWAADLKNVDNLKDCRSIKGKSERLLCYDTIADGGIFNEEKLQKVQVQNFGSKEKKADISIDELTVTVVHVQKDAGGIYYFQTSDGQVWKQRDRGQWSSVVPFEAVIKSGALGSFFLVNEGGKSIRVKRVK